MLVRDLGTMRYRPAWAYQEQIHAKVVARAEEHLLFVEHSPVITFGRRAEIEGCRNLLASDEALAKVGVELVQSDRGGDITFHGPGQIVAYPIIRLNDHRLSVGGYVRKLEQIIIDSMAELGISAQRMNHCVGIWVNGEKLCALGVRIRRGVSLHGIALNVETDLSYFDLIVPCGLVGKRATSLRKLMGNSTPSMSQVKDLLARHFTLAFAPAEPEATAATALP